MTHIMWNIDFDTDDEYWVKKDPDWYTDDDDPETHSSPFLRPEVVYGEDYLGMAKKRYHRKTVEYKDINRTVNEFVDSHGIR